MKRRPLLLKFGDMPLDVTRKWGDYPAIFPRVMGMDRADFTVVDPSLDQALPEAETLSGVVISGAAQMITDNHPWSLRTQAWLEGILDAQVPLLAICYGHHLLAQALGGTVDWNPNGAEAGSIVVELDDAASTDPVFRNVPNGAQFLTHHSQAVAQLPPGVTHLASNDNTSVQAFRWKDSAWGLQFHPEISAGLCGFFIDYDEQRGGMTAEDAARVRRGLQDSPYGEQVLRNFAALVLDNG